MSRTFTPFANANPSARSLVENLPSLKDQVPQYREAMREIGSHLASAFFPKIASLKGRDVFVICTVEDADFLARGIIEKLEEELKNHESVRTRMMCIWNERVNHNGISSAPIVKAYEEEYNNEHPIFVVVKSIISGACVVKTNIARAISHSKPNQIFVVSPIMLEGAECRLKNEFPDSISDKFEFIHFATDTDKSLSGEEVVPGIGGSIYELLGIGNAHSKNKYLPKIVRDRRKIYFPTLSAA